MYASLGIANARKLIDQGVTDPLEIATRSGISEETANRVLSNDYTNEDETQPRSGTVLNTRPLRSAVKSSRRLFRLRNENLNGLERLNVYAKLSPDRFKRMVRSQDISEYLKRYGLRARDLPLKPAELVDTVDRVMVEIESDPRTRFTTPLRPSDPEYIVPHSFVLTGDLDDLFTATHIDDDWAIENRLSTDALILRYIRDTHLAAPNGSPSGQWLIFSEKSDVVDIDGVPTRTITLVCDHRDVEKFAHYVLPWITRTFPEIYDYGIRYIADGDVSRISDILNAIDRDT